MFVSYATRPLRNLLPYSRASTFCSIYHHDLFHHKQTFMYQVDVRPKASVSLAQKEGIFQRWKNRLKNVLTDKARLNAAGVLVYEEIADGINYQKFLTFFQLPDTFQSWFLSVQLHVWMTFLITIDHKNGRFFRNRITDAMWRDLEVRIDKLAVLKSSRKKKYLEELNYQFQCAIIAYDEGILSDDKTLAAAAWRTFFTFQIVDPILLERIVAYIRMQVVHLEGQNLERILYQGKIQFKPLSSIFQDIDN